MTTDEVVYPGVEYAAADPRDVGAVNRSGYLLSGSLIQSKSGRNCHAIFDVLDSSNTIENGRLASKTSNGMLLNVSSCEIGYVMSELDANLVSCGKSGHGVQNSLTKDKGGRSADMTVNYLGLLLRSCFGRMRPSSPYLATRNFGRFTCISAMNQNIVDVNH
jgi:hypothetical protein